MFFRRIKTKASQKLLNSFLNLRSVKFKTGKIQSVGIIFDFNNFQDYDFFKLFFTDLGVSINGIRFISLVDSKDDKPNSWDAFYSKDDFD
tara:strand:+ start:238 stop:507 length:270 start_codon:yes stop_codon:yes gene_type:complete